MHRNRHRLLAWKRYPKLRLNHLCASSIHCGRHITEAVCSEGASHSGPVESRSLDVNLWVDEFSSNRLCYETWISDGCATQELCVPLQHDAIRSGSALTSR